MSQMSEGKNFFFNFEVAISPLITRINTYLLNTY